MSAYIVDEKHIQYLVNAAQEWDIYLPPCFFPRFNGEHRMRNLDPQKIGQMLWDANRSSVDFRYNEVNTEDIYHHAHVSFRYDPVQVLKAISCLDYQSCEREDWEATEACRFLNILKSAAISHLPGYEAAEWGVPENFGYAPVVISLYELATRHKKK